MSSSTFMEGDALYHVRQGVISEYSVVDKGLVRKEDVEGQVFFQDGMLYRLDGKMLWGRRLDEQAFHSISEDSPEDVAHVHVHGDCVFFLAGKGPEFSIICRDRPVLTPRDIGQFLFSGPLFYFLSQGVLQKLDLVSSCVEPVTTHRNVTSFSVRGDVVATGLKSGKVFLGNTGFHWHSSPIKSVQLSPSCNEVYSVSSKDVVHKYSAATQRSKVLFNFTGSFKSMKIEGNVLALETGASILLYDLKYERMHWVVYLFHTVEKHVFLDDRSAGIPDMSTALELRKDPIKGEAGRNTLVFKNDGLVFYVDVDTMDVLKVFVTDLAIEDFFADRDLLYILAEERLLVYVAERDVFRLVRRAELSTEIRSIETVIFRDTEFFLLTKGCVFKVSTLTGTLVKIHQCVTEAFTLGSYLFILDAKGISGPGGVLVPKEGVVWLRTRIDLFLGTREDVTVVSIENWNVVQRIETGNIKHFTLTRNGILILRNDGLSNTLLFFRQHGRRYVEESSTQVPGHVEKVFSQGHGIDAHGNVVHMQGQNKTLRS